MKFLAVLLFFSTFFAIAQQSTPTQTPPAKLRPRAAGFACEPGPTGGGTHRPDRRYGYQYGTNHLQVF